MNMFEQYIPVMSDSWKEKYQKILADEHLESLSHTIRDFHAKIQDWEWPYFNEEIKPARHESFEIFINILESKDPDEIKPVFWNRFRLNTG